MDEKPQKRAKIACTLCKRYKLKCDVETTNPCSQCKKRNVNCEVLTPKKRGRKPKSASQTNTTGAPANADDSAVPRKKYKCGNSANVSPTSNEPFVLEVSRPAPAVDFDIKNSDVVFASSLNKFPASITSSLLGLSIQAFEHTIQPLYPYFEFPYDYTQSWDVWKTIDNGVESSQIRSWSQMLVYLKNAVVFGIGCKLIGLDTEKVDHFLNRVYDNHLEKIDSFPDEHASEILNFLSMHSYYNIVKQNIVGAAESFCRTLKLANKHKETIDIRLITRLEILKLKYRLFDVGDFRKDELASELVKFNDIVEINEPSNQIILATLYFGGFLGLKDDNIKFESLSQKEFLMISNELSKAEYIINNNPLKHEWLRLFKIIIYSARAGIYAVNRLESEAAFWLDQSLTLCNKVPVPSTILFGVLHFLRGAFMKLTKPSYVQKIEIILERYGVPQFEVVQNFFSRKLSEAFHHQLDGLLNQPYSLFPGNDSKNERDPAIKVNYEGIKSQRVLEVHDHDDNGPNYNVDNSSTSYFKDSDSSTYTLPPHNNNNNNDIINNNNIQTPLYRSQQPLYYDKDGYPSELNKLSHELSPKSHEDSPSLDGSSCSGSYFYFGDEQSTSSTVISPPPTSSPNLNVPNFDMGYPSPSVNFGDNGVYDNQQQQNLSTNTSSSYDNVSNQYSNQSIDSIYCSVSSTLPSTSCNLNSVRSPTQYPYFWNSSN
eukprot:TRINITY_DN8670_c0_g1_i1.p1 TRINITY_DN8670_c0_g1~~TRINITY_DN8670_c0_g1_i1.p1  ORF type:complete len:713 (+),score=145.36 TRINITY_DN8670_c0_g1_i1:6-2144(+)